MHLVNALYDMQVLLQCSFIILTVLSSPMFSDSLKTYKVNLEHLKCIPWLWYSCCGSNAKSVCRVSTFSMSAELCIDDSIRATAITASWTLTSSRYMSLACAVRDSSNQQTTTGRSKLELRTGPVCKSSQNYHIKKKLEASLLFHYRTGLN